MHEENQRNDVKRPDMTATGGADDVSPPLSPPEIKGYSITSQIGEGGMGVVYEAWQEWPRRRVALKLMRAGRVSPSLLRRFDMEAEILGRLEHPAIARIYEAGSVDIGGFLQPYLSMELIDGQPVTDYVLQNCLSIRDRIILLRRVVDGVHYAHKKGVIHRDLKPANILVDAEGQPKILDFGVARVMESDLRLTTLATNTGSPVGTLAYMAPEQASGGVNEIDVRSDVYALGVIAFEILSERQPYPLKTEKLHEAVRSIVEDEPTRLDAIDTKLGGDLSLIVGKAMEKEKNRRYTSASALSADFLRYLTHEPIEARPPSAWYQMRKFARRHKVGVSASVAVVLALTAGLALASIGLVRARSAELAAQANLRRALDTVDQFTTFVAEGQLAAFPDLAPVRERLLDDAVFFYEQMLKDNEEDHALREELSWALARLAKAKKATGELPASRAMLEQRIARLEALWRETPHHPDHLRNLARTYFELTHVLERMRDADAALVAFEETHRLYRNLLEEAPDDRRLRMEMGYLLGNWSRLLDSRPAGERLREAITVWNELKADYPRDDSITRAREWTLTRISELDEDAVAPHAHVPDSLLDEGTPWLHATDNEALVRSAGQNVRVRGRIQGVNIEAGRERLTFLDFAPDRHAFTAIIHRNVLPAFTQRYGEQLELLQGRDVEIEGVISLHRDRPQMILSDPFMVHLTVPDIPAAKPPVVFSDELDTLRSMAGREVRIRGPIVNVGDSPRRTLTFLDFPGNNGEKASAIIHADVLPRIVDTLGGNPDRKLLGETVEITGTIYLYQNNPNIRITSPHAIKLIRDP